METSWQWPRSFEGDELGGGTGSDIKVLNASRHNQLCYIHRIQITLAQLGSMAFSLGLAADPGPVNRWKTAWTPVSPRRFGIGVSNWKVDTLHWGAFVRKGRETIIHI